MNKQGRGPSLTFLLIAIMAGVTAVILLSSFYSNFTNLNGYSYDSTYNSTINNITSSATGLNNLANNIESSGRNETLVQQLWSGGVNFYNTLTLGISTIGQTLALLPIMNALIETLGVIPAVSLLLGFFTSSIVVFFIYKMIQAKRGSLQEA